MPAHLHVEDEHERSYYASLALRHSLINLHCSLDDLEILGCCLHNAMAPWISPFDGSSDTRPQLQLVPRDLARALEAYNHVGPTFELAPGAIEVIFLPGPGTREFDINARRSLFISLPDGQQSVSGKYLLKSRKHWRAHHVESSASSIQDINRAPARQVIKLQIATLIAAVLCKYDHKRSDDIDPEIYLTSAQFPDESLFKVIKTTTETWRMSQLAEKFAITAGWVREDPSQADGLIWKPGPRFSDALTAMPPTVVEYAAAFQELICESTPAAVDALSYQIAEEIGPAYLREFLCKHGIEPNFHDIIEASKLRERISSLHQSLSSSDIKWLSEPVF